jgi:dTDP-4-amino-4,6-dideoxygalactose transaminase
MMTTPKLPAIQKPARVEDADPPAVPLLDLSRQYEQLRPQILAALEEVCNSQQFILGEAVTAFEAAAVEFLAAGLPAYAVGCASGTDALWLALKAAGIGPGDRVITSPFSFIASTTAILRCGATPVFADIDPASFNLSPDSVTAVLKKSSGKLDKIKAILPVHLYGQCADWDSFTAIKNKFGTLLIEDAAQAFGSKWNDTSAGLLGDIAAFSFYPTKNLGAFGDAGLVTTPSESLAAHVRILGNHGMHRRYHHDELGWNSRLDSLQAAILSVKLRHVAEWNADRRRIAARYDQLFTTAGLAADSVASGIVLPVSDPRAHHIFHQYVIRAPRRDDLRAHLAANNIGSEIYYPIPIHLQQSMKPLGYKPNSLPESERAAAEVLALPIFPELREEEQDLVVDAIRSFYS